MPVTPKDSRFAELYEEFYGHIFAFCRRRLSPDRVEDAVADVFMTAWRRIEDVPQGEDALLWLYKVAYRVVGRTWRTSSRKGNLKDKLSSIGVERVPTPEEVVVVNAEERRVLEAASRLRPRSEEILQLAVWDQLTHEEIGQILGISPGAARQRLHRAKQQLTREYNRLEKKHTASSTAQQGGAW